MIIHDVRKIFQNIFCHFWRKIVEHPRILIILFWIFKEVDTTKMTIEIELSVKFWVECGVFRGVYENFWWLSYFWSLDPRSSDNILKIFEKILKNVMIKVWSHPLSLLIQRFLANNCNSQWVHSSSKSYLKCLTFWKSFTPVWSTEKIYIGTKRSFLNSAPRAEFKNDLFVPIINF